MMEPSKEEKAYQAVLEAVKDCISSHGKPLGSVANEVRAQLEAKGAKPSVAFLDRVHKRGYL